MLGYYPNFKKEQITTKYIEREIADDELDIVTKFITFCAITAGKKKCADSRAIILQVRYILQVHYSHWSLEDLRNFLALLNQSDKRDWTKQGIKITLKRFIKWHHSDWNLRFANLEDIKLSAPSTQDKFQASNLLTPEDVETMVKAAESVRERALLLLLFESAARPQEIRSLKWKDVLLDREPPLVVLFSTKTKTSRSIPINHAAHLFRLWRDDWCFPNRSNNEFVFPDHDRSQPMPPHERSTIF